VPTDPRTIDPGGTPIRDEEPAPQPVQPVEAAPAPVVVTDYRPGTTIHVPSGAKARARANLAAIGLVDQLENEGRAATPAEQDRLAAWSGWGAVPQIFDGREDWAAENTALRGVLSEQEYRRAEANTLNAHYTDPEIAAALWDTLREAGFTGGRVLEPGCGSGTFLGLAPPEARMVGVELDPITAKISAYLYPSAQVRNEGFEATRVPENSFTATIGNVPFGGFAVHDPAHNPARHSIHNHFILKSLALTAPGGYVAVISSHFTMDSASQRARRDIAAVADLVGAVRLPTKAFDRVAGTAAVTDILLLRKREEGREPVADQDWIDTRAVAATDKDGASTETEVNAYFAAHPDNVLGQLHVGHGMYNADTLEVRRTGDLPLAPVVAERLSVIIREATAAGLALSATPESATSLEATPFDRGLLRADGTRQQTALATLRYDADSDTLHRFDGTGWVAHPARAGKVAETRELLHLRDVGGALIRAQLDGLPAGERDQLRGELNRSYDTYVRRAWADQPVHLDETGGDHPGQARRADEQGRGGVAAPQRRGRGVLHRAGPGGDPAAVGGGGVGAGHPKQTGTAPGRWHPQRPHLRHGRRVGGFRRGHPDRHEGTDLFHRCGGATPGADVGGHRRGGVGDQLG